MAKNDSQLPTLNYQTPPRWWPTWAIALALFVATFLLYVPSLFNDFVHVDDPVYILTNDTVKQGITLHGIKWAFTTHYFANWLPITWLSHMLDCQLFGLNPKGHHLTSNLIHAINASLVFLCFRQMTGATYRSLALALLFDVHPLRVESVSWLAERKDILCGMFFLLTLMAYTSYARRPNPWTYLGVMALYALGLMSKTMIVTLPFLLLLLDCWPLGRIARMRWRWLLLDKLPLLALAILAARWTLYDQGEGKALSGWEHLTLEQRLGNAVVSIPRYLWKIVRPADLSIVYVHPGDWAPWKITLSALLIFAITAACVALARRRPYLAVGWFWFCGMLVPVSGIIQAGDQAMADRYTYLPALGLVMAVIWLAADLAKTRPKLQQALLPATCILAAVFSVSTILQQGVWRDTDTLAENALRVDPNNWAAHVILAHECVARGQFEEGATHVVESSRGLRRVGKGKSTQAWLENLARLYPNRKDIREELELVRKYGK